MTTPEITQNNAQAFEIETGIRDARRQPGRPRLSPRRRWPRIIAILLAGLILIVQTTTAAASGSRASMFDIAGQSSKSAVGYEIGEIDGASGMLLASDPLIAASQELTASATARGDAPDALAAPHPDQTLETESAQSEPTLIIEDGFTSAAASTVWTGDFEGNALFIDEADGGWYVMNTLPGYHLLADAAPGLAVSDGIIVADARFFGQGVGKVGLFARMNEAGDHYFCGIDVYGGAGCYLYYEGQWYELFSSAPGEIARNQMDRLQLEVIGGGLIFSVNDQYVGVIEDAGLGAGSWGLVTECNEGECYGNFDYMALYDYAGGQEVPTEVVLDSDFSEPSDLFYTGQGDWGAAGVVDGWYGVSLAPGTYFPNYIPGSDVAIDGVLTTDVAFQGAGATGIIGRFTSDENGLYNYYVCWLLHDGTTGCNVVVGDVWYEIEGVENQAVELQEINRLSMALYGDMLAFGVNNQMVVEVTDATLTAGGWGFYTEAFPDSEGFTAWHDTVTLEQFVATQAAQQTEVEISTAFLNNDYGFYAGEGEWGYVGIYDGWYQTTLVPGLYFANAIAGTSDVQSGMLIADMQFFGDGMMGMVGRYQAGEYGESFYTCWVDSMGYAGCDLVVDDQWYNLAVTDQPLTLGTDTQLMLGLHGSQIFFYVNGAVVFELEDSALATGDWGLFTSSFTDGYGFSSYVDFLTLQEYIAV